MNQIDRAAAEAVEQALPAIAQAVEGVSARLKAGGPFNPPDKTTFYGGGAKGYTDYPALTD